MIQMHPLIPWDVALNQFLRGLDGIMENKGLAAKRAEKIRETLPKRLHRKTWKT